eukprot:1351932-Rhodomonas_salina.1
MAGGWATMDSECTIINVVVDEGPMLEGILYWEPNVAGLSRFDVRGPMLMHAMWTEQTTPGTPVEETNRRNPRPRGDARMVGDPPISK